MHDEVELVSCGARRRVMVVNSRERRGHRGVTGLTDDGRVSVTEEAMGVNTEPTVELG